MKTIKRSVRHTLVWLPRDLRTRLPNPKIIQSSLRARESTSKCWEHDKTWKIRQASLSINLKTDYASMKSKPKRLRRSRKRDNMRGWQVPRKWNPGYNLPLENISSSRKNERRDHWPLIVQICQSYPNVRKEESKMIGLSLRNINIH